MTILGIERITYGVTDLDTCRRFFADWGLKEVAHDETRANRANTEVRAQWPLGRTIQIEIEIHLPSLLMNAPEQVHDVR